MPLEVTVRIGGLHCAICCLIFVQVFLSYVEEDSQAPQSIYLGNHTLCRRSIKTH